MNNKRLHIHLRAPVFSFFPFSFSLEALRKCNAKLSFFTEAWMGGQKHKNSFAQSSSHQLNKFMYGTHISFFVQLLQVIHQASMLPPPFFLCYALQFRTLKKSVSSRVCMCGFCVVLKWNSRFRNPMLLPPCFSLGSS